MRKTGVYNIDSLLKNIAEELTNYFVGTNYVVHFEIEQVKIESNEPIQELVKSYVGSSQFEPNNLEVTNISQAKKTLVNKIKSKELNANRDNKASNINRALVRIEKFWQLVAHYVSLHEAEIYLYKNAGRFGIYWNYAVILKDVKSKQVIFISAGAWD